MRRLNYRGDEIAITLDHARDAKLTAFGKATLDGSYLMPGESYQDAFGRVAAYYSDDDVMAQEVYDAISNLWFMPATPVLSNGGTNRGLPISCFLNNVEDSLEGIDGAWSETTWLAARGGGVGTYWGDVRSVGEAVGDEEAGEAVGTTSGVIPFIKVQDSKTLGISQGSLRRGSAAVYLDIHHPEIEEFLDMRRETGDPNRRCLNIHHGVNVTDKFMEAMQAGGDFDLISPKDGSVRKTVKARDLWFKLLTARLEKGEPYIVFIDAVNRKSSEVYQRLGLKVKQSNLCSEIALTTGMDHLGKKRTAVCCLSSLNARTQAEWFGNKRFLRNVLVFLDNVLEDFITKASGMRGFEHAVYAAKRERSIGLGMMGFCSLLQSMGILYESAIAKGVNLKLWRWIKQAGDEINVEVANERGACPDAIDAGLNWRWAHKTAIAPTASISIICGTVSPAMEPFTANVFTQKTKQGSFEVRNAELDKRLRWYADHTFDQFVGDDPEVNASAKAEWVEDAWRSIMENQGSVQHLPFMTAHDKELFKTWEEIDQVWHASHAGDRDPFLDQMASNNYFLPPDVHKRDLHNLHVKLWRDGHRSAYYLRSRSLVKVTMATNTAGEMPQPTAPHEVVLKDRGEAIEPTPDDRYEVCLACQ